MQLYKLGCKVFAFDMDLTAVAQHSRGRLARKDLPAYLSKVTPSFVALAKALDRINRGGHRQGPGHRVFGAIATHSDAKEHDQDRPQSTHIIGQPLAEAVLTAALPADSCDRCTDDCLTTPATTALTGRR